MRTRWLGITAVLCVLGSAAAVLAVDAPHDASFTNGSCEACHKTHNSLGGTLMIQADNNTACTVCHNDPATTINQGRLGLPWIPEDQALPGRSGSQHRWDALAEAPAYGAQNPTDSGMLKRIKDGRLQCAACHDPHADKVAFDPAAQHVSMTPGVAAAQTGGTAGAMTMTLTAPLAGAATKGYRIQVLRINASSQPEIGISHDARALDFAPTWWVHNGTTWIVGTSAGSGAKFWASGAPVQLDDGANVVVSFTGTPTIGQYWDFYVSYAHLRASNVADAMCLQCHAPRNQSHTYVEGPGDGVKVFSHPVGVTLNINGKGYDRAAANVLDANGAPQPNDGNPTNDLTLVGGTTVSCTTCHNVHNADSNSLTTDAR